MRQYNFKSGGKYYHRVNKATARRVFNAGGVVIMCACNLRPDSYWSPSVPIAAGNYETPRAFDSLVNEYAYYNCNINECGKYAAFYTEEK